MKLLTEVVELSRNSITNWYMEKYREKKEDDVKAGKLHESTSKEKKNASEKYAVLNVCTMHKTCA